MEEYRKVNAQISQRMEYDEKSYELTLVTISAIIAAIAFVVGDQNYIW